jgi:aldehyde dehydrogenase (NAD+)
MPLPSKRAKEIVKQQQAKVPLHYIDGLFVESSSHETIRVYNPANQEAIGRVPNGNEEDVQRAVLSCKKAFENGWRDQSPESRARILLNLAAQMEAEGNDLAILETLQTGKTYREVLGKDVAQAIRVMRYYAGWVDKHSGDVFQLGGSSIGMVQNEAYPVVGALLPSASPLLSTCYKIGAAIAAGSTLVLKPSELTPLSVLRLGELVVECGAPAGVVNVVAGRGLTSGQALARSPHLESILFSGSIENARHVLVSAAKSNLKTVHINAGGKSANIIFEDADVKAACTAAWQAIFAAQGEVCSAGSRLLVQDSIYEQVVNVITTRAREITLGDPLDEHTEMGPVITEAQLKRILSYVNLGRKEGAKLVAGGMRENEGRRAQGFFVQPTVFMDVKPNMRIAQEEILGPVLSIMRFSDEAEALEIANGTDYAMASAVWTQNISRAQRMIKQLQSGIVWVNGYGQFDPALPFGGLGLSGHARELGQDGLAAFCYRKSIYLPGG